MQVFSVLSAVGLVSAVNMELRGASSRTAATKIETEDGKGCILDKCGPGLYCHGNFFPTCQKCSNLPGETYCKGTTGHTCRSRCKVCKHSEVANLARDGCEAATVPATPPPASYTIQDVWAKVATDNSMSIEELDLAFADPEGLLLSLCSTPGQNGECSSTYAKWSKHEDVHNDDQGERQAGDRLDSCGDVSGRLGMIFCKDGNSEGNAMPTKTDQELLTEIAAPKDGLLRVTLGCHSFMIQKTNGGSTCHLYQGYMDSEGTTGYTLSDGIRHMWNKDYRCTELAKQIKKLYKIKTNTCSDRCQREGATIAEELFFGTCYPYQTLFKHCELAPKPVAIKRLETGMAKHAPAWAKLKGANGKMVCNDGIYTSSGAWAGIDAHCK